MLNAEYDLLKKIASVSLHNRSFDPQAVPIDASNVQLYYQLIQHGYIIETSTGARLAPHTIDLLYLQEQIDEQRAEYAAQQAHQNAKNNKVTIFVAVLGLISTIGAAFLTFLLSH
jgi:hypothetical protein